MKTAINIQNVSDVITNSSSEIFICQTDNPEQTVEVIREVLTSVYENLQKARSCAYKNTKSYWGETLDDILTITVADRDGGDSDWGYSFKKGDILIESTEDNSIPSIIMDFIYEFFQWNQCDRHHLG